MIACNFDAVFLGIETPDVESLELTRKHQNNRESMQLSIRRIQRKGMRVMAGFIIGFDNEKPGAGDRLVEFVESCNITHGLLSMLQVLPNTGLYTRLSKEGRLQASLGTVNQTTLLNFVPTRPAAEIANEYLDALQRLYDPVAYMGRVYRLSLEVDLDRPEPPEIGLSDISPHIEAGNTAPLRERLAQLKLIASGTRLVWRQGVARSSRKVFWRYLWSLYRTRPSHVISFLALCAHNEHFIELTEYTLREIRKAVPDLSDEIYVPEPVEADSKKKRAPLITSHLAAQ